MASGSGTERRVSLPDDPQAALQRLSHSFGELGPRADRGAQRESTVQSATDAGDIFDLYDCGRDSAVSVATSRGGRTPSPQRRGTLNYSRPSRTVRQDDDGSAVQDMELLADEAGTSALTEGVRDRRSVLSEAETSNPQITITPDMTPSKAGPSSSVARDGRAGRVTAVLSQSPSLTTSVASSPTHPSIRRISPRPSMGTRSTSQTSRTSANDSRISFGSSQYPGEEDDAFHVRSTYARLEAGVYGDGWDQGVERTRGGPSGSSSKRATIFAPERGDLGPQERQYLSRLDRYGFVDEPLRDRSESRIALLPAAPFSKIPKLPKTSPLAGKPREQPTNSFRAPTSEPPAPRVPDARHEHASASSKINKENERVSKWMGMMTVKKKDHGGNVLQWGWRSGGADVKVMKRVYKGIPDRWRMAAWWTMAEQRATEAPSGGKGKKKAEDLSTEYRDRLDLPSTYDVQIDLDVPRTISGHTLFVTRYGSGQRSLFHVLHCFSMTCGICGYVQGMGPIAASLLCYFDPERVYALLIRLHDHYGMHSIFTPGFPGLLEAFYVQERLIEWLMPDVFQSFARNMISSTSWGTKWYITLFVNTVPFSQQLRIWDAFFLDGRDVMIMVVIAILWSQRDLLAHPAANFESILSLLSSYYVAEDEDRLMRWARKMLHQDGMRARMDAWRTEWADLVAQGKTDGILL